MTNHKATEVLLRLLMDKNGNHLASLAETRRILEVAGFELSSKNRSYTGVEEGFGFEHELGLNDGKTLEFGVRYYYLASELMNHLYPNAGSFPEYKLGDDVGIRFMNERKSYSDEYARLILSWRNQIALQKLAELKR